MGSWERSPALQTWSGGDAQGWAGARSGLSTPPTGPPRVWWVDFFGKKPGRVSSGPPGYWGSPARPPPCAPSHALDKARRLSNRPGDFCSEPNRDFSFSCCPCWVPKIKLRPSDRCTWGALLEGRTTLAPLLGAAESQALLVVVVEVAALPRVLRSPRKVQGHGHQPPCIASKPPAHAFLQEPEK